MMLDLDRLREGYHHSLQVDTEHLPDEFWERFARGELSDIERSSGMDHVLHCKECSVLCKGVIALREEAHIFDAEAPVPQMALPARSPHKWWGVFAGLTTVTALVVVMIVIFPLSQHTPGADLVRAAGGNERPILLKPVGSVITVPFNFSWKSVSGARGYVIEILDAEGEPAWKSKEMQALRTPAPSILRHASGRFYWRVLAIPKNGGKPIPSILETFDLSATPR